MVLLRSQNLMQPERPTKRSRQTGDVDDENSSCEKKNRYGETNSAGEADVLSSGAQTQNMDRNEEAALRERNVTPLSHLRSPSMGSSREVDEKSSRTAGILKNGVPVTEKKSTRVGSQYQVDRLPSPNDEEPPVRRQKRKRRKDNEEGRLSYDQVWDPAQGNSATSKAFMDSLPPLVKELGMVVLHEYGYNANVALEVLLQNKIIRNAKSGKVLSASQKEGSFIRLHRRKEVGFAELQHQPQHRQEAEGKRITRAAYLRLRG